MNLSVHKHIHKPISKENGILEDDDGCEDDDDCEDDGCEDDCETSKSVMKSTESTGQRTVLYRALTSSATDFAPRLVNNTVLPVTELCICLKFRTVSAVLHVEKDINTNELQLLETIINTL